MRASRPRAPIWVRPCRAVPKDTNQTPKRPPKRSSKATSVPAGDRSGTGNRDFRIFTGGHVASNIGAWMQNLLLGEFGYELTGSAVFVGVLFFAQLGPLLFMSTVGGVLADVVDRRKLLDDHPARAARLVHRPRRAAHERAARRRSPSSCASSPSASATGSAPRCGDPADPRPSSGPPGAVSLQSVQMNLSRVIGPPSALSSTRSSALRPVRDQCRRHTSLQWPASSSARYRQSSRARWRRPGWRACCPASAWRHRDPLIRRILTTLVLFSFSR